MMHKYRRVHFVGIAGVGMCGLAELLAHWGYRVSGSDLRAGSTLDHLASLGVSVTVGHEAKHAEEADLVVYSSAIPADNPELVEAHRREIPTVRRGVLLAEVMRLRKGIAVAGTHGKTTTTALIAHILSRTGLDPIALVGGRMELDAGRVGGAMLGEGDWLVAEADESDGSFLHLTPCLTVITNIDADHMEHYGDLATLETAFADFASRIPFWGTAVVCWDHPVVRTMATRATSNLLRYGTRPDSDLLITNIRHAAEETSFDLTLRGVPLGGVCLPLLGDHNVANAVAALGVAFEVGISAASAIETLASFGGVKRRFESKGSARGIRVVDDYGHHPVEVRATLDAARLAHSGRIVMVFQPHRFTRTRDCLADFASAFEHADWLVICDTYSAGESPIEGAESKHLADAVRREGHPRVSFIDTLDHVSAELPGRLEAGDLVITMGAGDITELGPMLLSAITREETS